MVGTTVPTYDIGVMAVTLFAARRYECTGAARSNPGAGVVQVSVIIRV